jgi:peptidoglycan/xylan/chitin deacetylase (PgdA/CDA1 family)
MNNPVAVANLPESRGQLDLQNNSKTGPAHSFEAHIAGQWIWTYHEILPAGSQYLYGVTQAQFREHLSLLASAPPQSSPGKQSPLITFDDGHRSNFEQAFPLLEQFGLKATFFLVAGCVGNIDKYLSWEQARQMVAAGHRVESHGWSHRLLTQCSASDLEQEVARSKHELEDRLGVGVLAISAPGGRWDERVVEACARAGYKYLYHSNPWIPAGSRQGLHLRGRHMVTGRMGPKDLQNLVQTRGARRLYFRCRYGAKEQVRVLVGDRLYHRFWSWVANPNSEEGIELDVDSLSKNKRESRLL